MTSGARFAHGSRCGLRFLVGAQGCAVPLPNSTSSASLAFALRSGWQFWVGFWAELRGGQLPRQGQKRRTGVSAPHGGWDWPEGGI